MAVKTLRYAALACIAFMALHSVSARVHELSISNDDRMVFSIEDFGFQAGGTADLKVTNFKISGAGDGPFKAGFYMTEIGSETEGIQLVEKFEASITSQCPLADEDNVVLSFDEKANWAESSTTRTIGESGFWIVIFVKCLPVDTTVDFNLRLEMYNPPHNYLSAGDVPLPSMYLTFTVAYVVCLFVWVYFLRQNVKATITIHHMMTVLLVFKTLSLCFESVTFFNVKVFGHAIGWNVLFYIFAVLKGIMLFVTVLLVGTGWGLLKPFLSGKEKKVLMVVLALQVFDNIALIVVDELAPGSTTYSRWKDALHLVDIACCCAILLPIVWQIHHLRQAAATDGKAANTLKRLAQFRGFYLMTVGYIYFTRIIVYLLALTLSYNLTWLGPFFTELATIVYFVAVGYKFRPVENNPYLRVQNQSDEEDESEFGLDAAAGSGDEAKPTIEMATIDEV